MQFNDHHNLEGMHAFLGASKYAWTNYDDDHLLDVYHSSMAAQEGTELHAIAEQLIRKKIKLPNTHKTLNMHVNDAIRFHMSPEVVLFYSPNCFGTSDAISFDGRLLRIHDLKTGSHPAKMTQLYIYGALFCLEYNIDPKDIRSEFRIYQNDDIFVDDHPNVDEIHDIMGRIIHFDDLINQEKERMQEL